jgi:NADH:ubiquinone oxidoreductase subunit 6 (subunit J)
MGELIYTVAFYVLAAITLIAAAGVVFNRNLVHSAFLLALTFIGVAGLYVLLQADFLAAVQILVYSGAVAVIIVIGVMLTRWKNVATSSPSNKLGWGAALATLLLTGIIVCSVLVTPWNLSAAQGPAATASAIAAVLFSDYMVAFEAVAVLLLVAMVGAIILARGAEN